jgi:hypothetical protein
MMMICAFGAIAGIAGAGALTFGTGCTPQARGTGESALNTISSVGNQAGPAVCQYVGAQGTACGAVVQDVSDVAKLIADILATIPNAATKGTIDTKPVQFMVRGVAVTLPAFQAAFVRAHLGDGGT